MCVCAHACLREAYVCICTLCVQKCACVCVACMYVRQGNVRLFACARVHVDVCESVCMCVRV